MKSTQKPNIIIINPDQMRADSMRHLGNSAAYTPNLDALAHEGASFSRAFCQNPVCVPSRCSFMTGLYPHTLGHRTMAHLLQPREENLFSDMKRAGYYTVSSTRGDLMAGQYPRYHKDCIDEYIKIRTSHTRKAVDFKGNRGNEDSDTFYSFFDGIIPTDHSEDVAPSLDDLTVDSAIRSIVRRPSDKPLFMFVGLNYPHPPYQIERKYYDLIDKSALQKRIPNIQDSDGKPSMETALRDNLRVSGWSEERLIEIRTVYLAMCSKVDEMVGRIVKALKDEGIYDSTAILFFSDHGDYTGDYGLVEKCQNCFPDCLINVPLIIKPDSRQAIEPGINENFAELTDICASCYELAGIKAEREQFGKSLLPMMKDRALELHKYVFCEGGRLNNEVQASEADAYIEKDRYAPRLGLQGKMPYHTKAAMIRTKQYKYIKRLYENDEFYVLEQGESINKINEEQYKEFIESMQKDMLDMYMTTCDIVPNKLDDRFTSDFIANIISTRGFPRIVGGVLKLYLKISHQSAGEFVKKIRKKYKM